MNRRVYVGNLAWDVSWQDLKDYFKQIGHVLRAEVMSDSNGRSKGCGIVEFSTSDDAINGNIIFIVIIVYYISLYNNN